MARADARVVDDEIDRGHARALRRLPGRAYWLIGLVALGMLGAWLVLEIQASVTAYVNAEGLWSKMQKQSVLAMYRYSGSGDPRDLAEARQTLRTPLEDLALRQALDRDPPDLEAAYRHVRAAGNRPEDHDRLIWVYRLLADAPYLRDSVRAWRRTDADLRNLAGIADELEARWRRGTPDADEIAAYRSRLYEINARIYPLTVEFSDSLARGAAAIRRLLLLSSAVAFALLAWYSLRVMQHTLRHVRETEAEFRMAFHQAAVGMLKLAPDGRIVQANEALAKLLGMSLAELRDMRVQDIVPAEDLDRTADGADWQQWLQSGERRLLTRDGRVRWVRWTASPLARPGASADRIFVLLEDVSDAHAMAREIAHQATHDELTGLINRREIGRRLGEGLAQARRGDIVHTLAFIDVDRFKLVNDTCGHAVGDRFLRRFVNLLSEQLQCGDWLGRLGGDEFAVFLHGADLGRGLRTMEEIHGLLSRTSFRWDGREMPFHCSVGLVEVNASAADVEWLLSAADAACYLAKEEGRNRVRAYSDANRALARRRYDLDWVTSAQAAIAERRLLMYAQKIVPLHAPEAGLRYEVLVRMRGMDGVLHPPGEFLMAMERFGQATAVDGHVLDAVLGEFDRHPAHLQRLASCHVNISAQSIADPAFLARVTERLDRRPAVASRLCFELTETAMIGNLADARRFIDAVRERGCRVALDDFGSGLSSFAYLKDLPVDIVKIDSAFVRDIGKGGSDLAMVRSMAQVARALGKETIAEGIESAETPPRLARIGIDFAQGYALHEPCPLEELIRQAGAGGEAWPIMQA